MFRALQVTALLSALLVSGAYSQQPAPAASKDTAVEKAYWRERANLITAAIEEDAPQLPPDLQLILPGRLGDLWRRVDPKRADAWLEQTVAKLTTRPETETPDQQRTRLLAGATLWPELSKSDRAAADHLLDAMVTEIEQTMPDLRAPGRMTVVGRLAMQVGEAVGESAREDPQRAYGYAKRIIQMGVPEQLLLVYVPLRASDPQLADRFAFEALQAARTNGRLFDGLAQIAVPNYTIPERYRAPPPVSSAILDALAESMLRPQLSPADTKNVCSLTWAATMAMSGFKPEQQAQIRSVIESCKNSNPALSRTVRAAENIQRGGTPSHLLAKAAEADDAQSRAGIKDSAARRAAFDHDYLRALHIMDSFTPEEREASPQWKRQWRDFAAGDIAVMYDARDLQGIQRLIERAPDEGRAYLLLTAARSAFASKEDAYAVAMLTQARRDLEKNAVTSDYDGYVELLNLYAERVPEEAAAVLRLAVDGINGHKQSSTGYRAAEPGWQQLRPVELRSGLLEADPEMVRAALAELKSPPIRVAMRLGLLKLCLDRYAGPAGANRQRKRMPNQRRSSPPHP